MKKLTLLTAAVGLALSSQLVHADPYIGAKLGNTWLDNSCESGYPCDDSSFAAGIYAGYEFADFFGLEADYQYLGDFKTSYTEDGTVGTIDKDLAAYSLSPKFTLPIDALDLFAKLGVARVEQGSMDDTVLLSALGAEYSFTEDLAARLEYQRLNNIQDKFEGMDVDSAFLGLTYTFGSARTPMYDDDPIITEPEPVPEPQPVAKMEVFKEFGTELFATDSFALAAGSEEYFDEIVAIMVKFPQANLEVVGHTDSRGSEAYNQKLSEERAKAVANYIIGQGVDSERVTYKGMGELEPKASNNTAEGRKLNRRVEVSIEEFEYQVE